MTAKGGGQSRDPVRHGAEATIRHNKYLKHPQCVSLINGPTYDRGRQIFEFGNYNTYYRVRKEALENLKQREVPAGCSSAKGAQNAGDIDDSGSQWPGSRSSKADPRLRAITSAMGLSFWKGKRVLDIGCNAGLISLYIAGVLQAASVVGIDIDVSLIETALRMLRAVKARYCFAFVDGVLLGQWPAKALHEGVVSSTQSQVDEIAGILPSFPLELTDIDENYLELAKSLVATDQSSSASVSLPISSRLPPFPFNLEFRSDEINSSMMDELRQRNVSARDADAIPAAVVTPADSVSLQKEGDSEKISFAQVRAKISTSKGLYDIVLALSITKWIHLRGGDSAIKHFFRKVYDLLQTGGYLVLEPQSWGSYRKKRRIKDEFRSRISTINLKPQLFDEYLTKEIGFEHVKTILPEDVAATRNDVSCDLFNRSIFIYQKPIAV